MILAVLQFAVVALVALYLGWFGMGVRRRNNRSWERIISRLRHDWHARELSEHFPWKEGLRYSPDETWERIGGCRGLRGMAHNAKVMLEMADYAARNSDLDPQLIALFREDAAQIRLAALKLLIQCTLSQATEDVRVRTFQVASAYTGMVARMTEFLQENAAGVLPEFVAAM